MFRSIGLLQALCVKKAGKEVLWGLWITLMMMMMMMMMKKRRKMMWITRRKVHLCQKNPDWRPKCDPPTLCPGLLYPLYSKVSHARHKKSTRFCGGVWCNTVPDRSNKPMWNSADQVPF
ncbi:UNVERIFIED_CONTAM: hypothetical protein FKN15_039663 [Acipenser sinensis]